MNDDTDPKPTAKIFELPGIDRRDFGTKAKTIDVLQYAIDYGITDVIVLGRNRDGSRYIAAEDGNLDAVVGKLFSEATRMASSEMEHCAPPASDPRDLA